VVLPFAATVAFKAFDMGNRGVVTLGDMAAAIKDITSTVSTPPCSPPALPFPPTDRSRLCWASDDHHFL
jgi:hypothetical protein